MSQQLRPWQPSPKLMWSSIAVLVCAVLLYFAWQNLPWRNEKVDRGYSTEAQRNNYLAVGKFLRRFGLDTHVRFNRKILNNLDSESSEQVDVPDINISGEIPPDIASEDDEDNNVGRFDTLIFINGRSTLRGERFNEVWQWVENGGTLVYSVKNPYVGAADDGDDLFDALGLYYWSNDEVDEDFDEDSEEFWLDEPDEDGLENNELENGTSAEGYSSEDTSSEKLTSLEKTNGSNSTPKRRDEGGFGIPREGEQDDEKNSRANDAEAEGGFSVDTTSTEDQSETGDAQDETPEDVAATDDFELSEDWCADWNTTELSMRNFDRRINVSAWVSGELEFTDDALTPRALVRDGEDSIVFAQYDVGDGTVFVSTDNKIWQNKRIHCDDNAAFLTQLVHPDGDVWFLVNENAPSLYVITWQRAPYLVIGFFAIILFWLWNRIPRFGPIIRSSNIHRRSFSEHLSASSNFMWKNKQYARLLEHARTDLIHRLRRYDGLYADMTDAEKITLVVGLTGLTRQQVYVALFKPAQDVYADFVQAVARLKEIKEKL